VLDPGGYRDKDGRPADGHSDYKIKSRRIARDINVTMQSGKTATKTVYEKQVVFWSKKYADKAKAERYEVVLKARALIKDPQKHTRATSYGAAKYVKNLAYDKNTGEVLDTGKVLAFDEDRVREEELYDGYYSIVTSELEMSDQQIVDTYRGLWEIEETFRITKSTVEIRPVYVSLRDRIEAHVLSCFIALTIMRLLQKRTGRRYSCDKIVECLNSISCTNEQENIYLFNYRSEIADAIGQALEIDFTKKRMPLGKIKNLLANSKK
jgi:transposase